MELYFTEYYGSFLVEKGVRYATIIKMDNKWLNKNFKKEPEVLRMLTEFQRGQSYL